MVESSSLEVTLYSSEAHVFEIDPETKDKWVPRGNSIIPIAIVRKGRVDKIIALVHGEVVLKSIINPKLDFNRRTEKFGQWVDQQTGSVFGLGFNSELELDKFVEALNNSIENMANNNDHQTTSVVTAAEPEANGLKSQNERLKQALDQNLKNATLWQQEVQTLRHNNVTLTNALKESKSNVEEWKRELDNLKLENEALKQKIAVMSDDTEHLTELEAKDSQIEELRNSVKEMSIKLDSTQESQAKTKLKEIHLTLKSLIDKELTEVINEL